MGCDNLDQINTGKGQTSRPGQATGGSAEPAGVKDTHPLPRSKATDATRRFHLANDQDLAVFKHEIDFARGGDQAMGNEFQTSDAKVTPGYAFPGESQLGITWHKGRGGGSRQPAEGEVARAG